MDRDASMRPLSTWARALSTWRAKKGTEPNTRGTMAPFTLMVVPMMARVTGMTQVSRMMKGMERNRLMSLSST